MPTFAACVHAFVKKDGSSKTKQIAINENFQDDFPYYPQ
jgi:hypothetical protein